MAADGHTRYAEDGRSSLAKFTEDFRGFLKISEDHLKTYKDFPTTVYRKVGEYFRRFYEGQGLLFLSNRIGKKNSSNFFKCIINK